jgi:hypothetical protein
MPFLPRTRGEGMKWKGAERHQIIANLPSEARSIFTPGLAWLLAGLRTCRHGRSKMTGVSTDPSSRFQRKPVVIGCSILLTAAGQSRIRTGFPLGAPRGETPPAIDAQHKGLFSACQSECCGLVKYVRIYVHSPRPLVRIPGAVTMCCAEIKSKANTDSSQVAKSQFRTTFGSSAKVWVNLKTEGLVILLLMITMHGSPEQDQPDWYKSFRITQFA